MADLQLTPVPGTGYPAAAIVHFEITLESFRLAAAKVSSEDDVAVVDARTGRVLVDSRFSQRLGAPLGRPGDDRFSRLAQTGASAGTMMVAGQRVAFRRLARTENNANDWYVVAIDRDATGALGEFGWAPLGMAAAAVLLLILTGTALAAVLFDLDHFKKVNDQ